MLELSLKHLRRSLGTINQPLPVSQMLTALCCGQAATGYRTHQSGSDGTANQVESMIRSLSLPVL